VTVPAPIPAFDERGGGDTAVVMLHGVGGGRAAWAGQLESFGRAGYRAVAWDAPGYGDSRAIDPYDMAGLARSLGALLEALAVRRVVLLGHSMGGLLAQEAAVAFPGKLAGLVLSATSPAFGKPAGDWQQAFLRQRLDPLDAGKTMADLAPALVGGMIGPKADPAGVRLATDVMSRVPSETYRKALRAIVGFDRRATLAEIAMPVLAVAGEHDATAPPAVMERMAQKVPGAEYVRLAGCGHLANLERPRTFDEAVLGWLARRFPH
jgi:3-oxoadipate enol-lactonase